MNLLPTWDAALQHLPEGSAADLRDISTDSVGCFSHLYRTYGPLVAFSKGSQRVLFAFGRESNRLLFEQPEIFHGIGFLPGPKNSPQRRLGNGVFNLNGGRHKAQRRLILPPFQKSALVNYVPLLVDLVEELLAGWQPGQQFDLVAELKVLALRITMRLLFGVNDIELARQIDVHFEEWMELNHRVAFQSMLPVEPCTESYRRMLEYAGIMETLIGKLVARRRETPLGTEVLSALLRGRDAGMISDVEVAGHTTHLFNAAYHTTTYALTWTLFLLAQHPDVMARLHAELSEGSSDAYLERCIRESLRVLPPSVDYARIIGAPADFGPHRLQTNSVVVGSIYVTHHMRELYDDPECYRPDRWLTTPVDPYAYIPFGGGARMCVGSSFAQLMLKTCLGAILRRFRLAVVPGARIERKSSLTLGPRFGIPVTIHVQDGRFTCAPVVGNIHEMVALPAPASSLRAA